MRLPLCAHYNGRQLTALHTPSSLSRVMAVLVCRASWCRAQESVRPALASSERQELHSVAWGRWQQGGAWHEAGAPLA
jgi:hypothetical protein